MSEIVERSSLDLRYEGHRLQDATHEARLLASIAERGIEEPLEGVDSAEGRFLLDGFKRYQEGFLTDEPDLSIYDDLTGQDNATNEPESEDHDG